jgi:predicted TIM-barrel fold metal-dependent hydrolase
MTTPHAPFIAASEFYLLPANTSPTESSIGLIPAPTLLKLRNVGLPRIKDMRATGVTTQIISHIPIYANPQSCRKINDALNAAIYMSPDRFAAMALLPALDGQDAARELQRCVTKNKFVGGVLALRQDVRIDEDGFEELWAVAEKYRVPIAVRDVWPSLEQVGFLTSWSWHLGRAVAEDVDSRVRRQLSGLLSRFPRRQLLYCA